MHLRREPKMFSQVRAVNHVQISFSGANQNIFSQVRAANHFQNMLVPQTKIIFISSHYKPKSSSVFILEIWFAGQICMAWTKKIHRFMLQIKCRIRGAIPQLPLIQILLCIIFNWGLRHKPDSYNKNLQQTKIINRFAPRTNFWGWKSIANQNYLHKG